MPAFRNGSREPYFYFRYAYSIFLTRTASRTLNRRRAKCRKPTSMQLSFQARRVMEKYMAARYQLAR